jgi:uncharacterized protein (TIGR00369 family)
MSEADPVPFTMPFANLLGVTVTTAKADQVSGTLEVREALCTTGKRLHGGAIMALADNLGAIGAFLSRPQDSHGTTTLESKTNFLGAAKQGTTVFATATPLHVGRRTSVWQTRIETEDGKPVAIVTQTQMVL